MTNQEILAGAPEGATHYSYNTYCKAKKDTFQAWDGEGWCAYYVPGGDIRSLADIRRIAELESYNLGLANESHAQQVRIEELESGLNLCKEFLELIHQMDVDWTIKESVTLREILIERLKGGE